MQDTNTCEQRLKETEGFFKWLHEEFDRENAEFKKLNRPSETEWEIHLKAQDDLMTGMRMLRFYWQEHDQNDRPTSAG